MAGLNRISLLALLLITPLGLAAWVGQLVQQRSGAVQVELPIEGFDPRDYLQGHYLTYRISYPVKVDDFCQQEFTTRLQEKPVQLCLNPAGISATPNPACQQPLNGTCSWSRFEAGIERFYIPEGTPAEMLEKAVMAKKASVVINLQPNGKATLNTLKIEGTDWKEWLASQPLADPVRATAESGD